ncbi:MAG TPA: adenylyltransferase/cytidyltransferase family protein [Chlamydiales bacterium]|nr:adenylyltransferase/cytidyltransferase family protein [Chlamydiales bacterium]
MWSTVSTKKLILPEKLELWAQKIKDQGLTIATINGSFDLMHAGHLHILYEASKQADVLLVALNSDASIQGYKSISRPIIPLKYRLQMMAAIEFVDFITYFDELTPCNLLQKVRPFVHCNGAEYGADCIEKNVVEENGGRVHIINLVEGLSTSKIIEKVKLCDK